MDLIEHYYSELRRILGKIDPTLEAEFSSYAVSHKPNETWLWLDGRAKELRELYWTIR